MIFPCPVVAIKDPESRPLTDVKGGSLRDSRGDRLDGDSVLRDGKLVVRDGSPCPSSQSARPLLLRLGGRQFSTPYRVGVAGALAAAVGVDSQVAAVALLSADSAGVVTGSVVAPAAQAAGVHSHLVYDLVMLILGALFVLCVVRILKVAMDCWAEEEEIRRARREDHRRANRGNLKGHKEPRSGNHNNHGGKS
jgi:hypothetical protein